MEWLSCIVIQIKIAMKVNVEVSYEYEEDVKFCQKKNKINNLRNLLNEFECCSI